MTPREYIGNLTVGLTNMSDSLGNVGRVRIPISLQLKFRVPPRGLIQPSQQYRRPKIILDIGRAESYIHSDYVTRRFNGPSDGLKK